MVTRSGSECSVDGGDSAPPVRTHKSTKSSCEILQPSISDMKLKVKNNLKEGEVEEEEFDVKKLYHETGKFQAIAKHDIFENCTLFVIASNAVYIAVDTDWSKAETLTEKEPFFQFMEHAFCAYFTWEWIIRFGAFERKLDGRKSGWFVFDSALVFMMVAETWVMTILASVTGTGKLPFPTAILRLFRLLRLSRLIRMLKSFPELMILIRGMVSALWAGTYVLALLIICMYIFAILCVQLGSQDDNISQFFANIPLAMYSLFIFATFLDDLAFFMDKIRLSDGYTPYLLLPFIFLFIALSSMTIMNMLVGVLCEVVSEVADDEKEKIKCETLKTTMGYVMNELDKNFDGFLSFQEFESIMTMPKALDALKRVDVSPENIVDLAELFFQKDMDVNGPFLMPEKDGDRHTELRLDANFAPSPSQADNKRQQYMRHTKREVPHLDEAQKEGDKSAKYLQLFLQAICEHEQEWMRFPEYNYYLDVVQGFREVEMDRLDEEVIDDNSGKFLDAKRMLQKKLSQDDFTDMILRLRDSETAKVTDILDWQDKITQKMGKNGGALQMVEEGFDNMRAKIDQRNNDVAAKINECKDLLEELRR